jgi:hypothetical protein
MIDNRPIININHAHTRVSKKNSKTLGSIHNFPEPIPSDPFFPLISLHGTSSSLLEPPQCNKKPISSLSLHVAGPRPGGVDHDVNSSTPVVPLSRLEEHGPLGVACAPIMNIAVCFAWDMVYGGLFGFLLRSPCMVAAWVHSATSMLDTLGERDESRVDDVEVRLRGAEGVLEREIWPSASTWSRGMRSIWRPTRLGM